MKIILDTHVFLWLITDDLRLSNDNKALILDMEHQVFLSVASIWECVIKQQIGKLPLPDEAAKFLSEQRNLHQIDALTITEQTIAHLHQIPLLHKDPFDRLLICQAIENKAILLTEDSTILQYQIQGLNLMRL